MDEPTYWVKRESDGFSLWEHIAEMHDEDDTEEES